MAAIRPARGGFVYGVICGLGCCSLLLLVLPGWLQLPLGVAWREALPALWSLVQLNLQGAVIPFVLLLICYLGLLHRLQSVLGGGEPPLSQVLRLEQLLDLAATLFFGVGVIWTAVGMRSALLHGLGDPDAGVGEGAFAVLQRLVEGGILLALSTTIVGGMGGYLMRLIKTLWLGAALNTVYMRAQQQRLDGGLASLQRIEALLSNGAVQRGVVQRGVVQRGVVQPGAVQPGAVRAPADGAVS
jgi:hypothetical protein